MFKLGDIVVGKATGFIHTLKSLEQVNIANTHSYAFELYVSKGFRPNSHMINAPAAECGNQYKLDDVFIRHQY